MSDQHHIRSFATRPTTLSPTVTWLITGDTLVRERSGRCDTLAIHTLEEVRLWRSAMVPGTHLGGNLEAKLRLDGRWWRMSAHHAKSSGIAVDCSAALADVLTLALRVRMRSPGVVPCRVGSQAQRIGAALLILVLVVTVGIVGYLIHSRGMPKDRTVAILALVGPLIGLFGMLAIFIRGGHYEHLTVDELLKHPYLDPPMGSDERLHRVAERLRDVLDRNRRI